MASTISADPAETSNRMQADSKDANRRDTTLGGQHQIPGSVIFPNVDVDEGQSVFVAERMPRTSIHQQEAVIERRSHVQQLPAAPIERPVLPYRPSPEAAWEYFRRLGSPKLHVAPMVDASELPFRMLCRRWGAEAAYTPMIHSRLFLEAAPKHRHEHFTTCPEDRPLFVQFCANDPATLLGAAKLVEHQCDYVDLNLGCPQRIAKRGNYGAFLMDNLPLVRALVSTLTSNLSVPVSCKIRVFPNLDNTLAYARMLEEAGCALLAVHGRTRDQKCGKLRADWDAIRAVKQAMHIPVLANGNIRWLEDAEECMRYTGTDGVLSAETLLSNPALFSGHRMPGDRHVHEEESFAPRNGSSQNATTSIATNVATNVHGMNQQASSEGRPLAGIGNGAEPSAASVRVTEPSGPNGDSSSERGCADSGRPSEGEHATVANDGRIPWKESSSPPDPTSLMLEYLDLCEQYPVPMRMVRGHVHRILGGWFRLHTDLRMHLNKEHKITLAFARDLVAEIRRRKEADPTLVPLPESVNETLNGASKERGGGASDRMGGYEKRAKVGGVEEATVPMVEGGEMRRAKLDVKAVVGSDLEARGSEAQASSALLAS